jgi:hypothetical protein
MNTDILKWIVLLGSAPFWLPFARALWEELNEAMRPDGGVFGKTPGPLERKQIEQEMEREPPRVVHETLAHHRMRRARGESDTGTAEVPHPGAPRPRGGPQAGGSRRPFVRRTR